MVSSKLHVYSSFTQPLSQSASEKSLKPRVGSKDRRPSTSSSTQRKDLEAQSSALGKLGISSATGTCIFEQNFIHDLYFYFVNV